MKITSRREVLAQVNDLTERAQSIVDQLDPESPTYVRDLMDASYMRGQVDTLLELTESVTVWW